MSKSVEMYDINNNFIKKYDYISQAEIDGFNRKYISECAVGKRKTYKGYIWKFISM